VDVFGRIPPQVSSAHHPKSVSPDKNGCMVPGASHRRKVDVFGRIPQKSGCLRDRTEKRGCLRDIPIRILPYTTANSPPAGADRMHVGPT
jgi:hypothetical protein